MLSRFRALFAGLPRAWGEYVEAAQGERKGRGITRQGALGDAQFTRHLAGKQRLGIVPIRDDNSVVFGAIDIDDYSTTPAQFTEQLVDFPLCVTRSKSGGTHIWLFLAIPLPAAAVRDWLTQVALLIGYPGAEVFPKQSALASDEDVGNWINIPYFDAERTTCYGVLPDGSSQLFADWLDTAEASRVDALPEIKLAEPDLLEGAPPCLQTLARQGIPEGMRNKALFAFGVYAKKAHDPGWEDFLGQINVKYMDPPLQHREVEDTIKSLRRKKYFYPCAQDPIRSVCNKALCRKCEHGIGGDVGDPGISIESISKVDSDPPFYFVQVNGQRIEIAESGYLLNQVQFRKLVFEKLDIIPQMIKEAAWAALINELMKNAHHVEAPSDASAYGQFIFHLTQFCTARQMARTRDELLLGRPWRDDGAGDPPPQSKMRGLVWFRSSDLLAYLERQRFRAFTTQRIWAILREDLGAEHAFWNIRGGGVNAWGLKMGTGQTEPFDVPAFEQGGDPLGSAPGVEHGDTQGWNDAAPWDENIGV
jgi:hypothetical protein